MIQRAERQSKFESLILGVDPRLAGVNGGGGGGGGGAVPSLQQDRLLAETLQREAQDAEERLVSQNQPDCQIIFGRKCSR